MLAPFASDNKATMVHLLCLSHTSLYSGVVLFAGTKPESCHGPKTEPNFDDPEECFLNETKGILTDIIVIDSSSKYMC